MGFYLGKWFVDDDPNGEGEWCLPTDYQQHVRETQNPSELRISPEDLEVTPSQVQIGCESWTQINFVSNSPDWKVTTHAPDSLFYLEFYLLRTIQPDCWYLLPEDC